MKQSKTKPAQIKVLSSNLLLRNTFRHIENDLKKDTYNILSRAMILNNCLHDTVSYRGKIYTRETTGNYVPPINKLPEELREEMDKIINTKEKLEKVKMLIGTYMAFVFNKSADKETLKKFLPRVLHEEIDSCEYINPVGSTYTDEEIEAMKMTYKEQVDMLNFYLFKAELLK